MPAIPMYERRVAPAGSLGIGSTDTGNIGPAVEQAGRALGGVAVGQANALLAQKEQEGAAWAGKAIAEARLYWTQELQRRQQTAQPGAFDFTPQTAKDFDTYKAGVLKAAPSGAARRFIDQRLTDLSASVIGDAMGFEATARRSWKLQQAEEGVSAARLTARARPDQFQTLSVEQEAAIMSSGLEPAVATEAARKARVAIASDAVMGLASRDPLGLLTMLHAEPGKSGNAAVEALDADARLKLTNFAESELSRLVTLRNQQDALAERQQRDIEDATSKRGDQLLSAGQLTSEWVRDNAANLSAADHRYFQKALTGGEVTRDLTRYADLAERASRGEDVRGDARAALLDFSISKADYDRITSLGEGERPGWYKRGTRFINGAAAVSDLNPDPAAAQRKAQMLDDWDEWAAQHPKATDTEAKEAYNRIVDEYSLIERDTIRLTLRKPQFLVGGYNAPDLQATKAQTAKAFREGRIDRAELDRQAALIQQWENTMQKAVAK